MYFPLTYCCNFWFSSFKSDMSDVVECGFPRLSIFFHLEMAKNLWKLLTGFCVCPALKNYKFSPAIQGARRNTFTLPCYQSQSPPFPRVAQIFIKQTKRNEGHTMQQYWLTYEVKIFLHMNLPYGLIKHVLKEIAVCHFEGRRYQWYDPCHCWPKSWLPHGAAEVTFKSAQRSEWSFYRTKCSKYHSKNMYNIRKHCRKHIK